MIVMVFASASSTSAYAADDEFVRIVTGASGGSWYPLGAKMAEFIGDIDGLVTSNGPGGGVGNLLDVANRDVELAWSYGHSAYDALRGNPPFRRANPDLRHVATFYPSAITTVVPEDSSITSYADMQDKNVSPGYITFSSFAAAQVIYKKYGFTVEDIRNSGGTVHHIGYTDSVSLMKDGHIDAFTAIVSYPQASILDLEFNPGVRFIPVDEPILEEILEENPGYIRVDLTNEHYDSIKSTVPTLGAVAILVTHKDVSDDTIYKVTKAIWENHDELARVKDVWNSVKLEDALLGATLEVHPGAKKYYDEQGVK